MMSDDNIASDNASHEPAKSEDASDRANDAIAEAASESASTGQGGSLKQEVDAVIKRHAAYGLASGVIPVPLVDLTVSSTVQLRMIAQLAELYGIPFSEQVAKGTVASLVSSAIPLAGVGAATFSVMRAVPLVGPILGLATLPALYAAITYAVGRTFAWHFSQGGNFDTIDPKAFRARFSREFSKARDDAGSEQAAA